MRAGTRSGTSVGDRLSATGRDEQAQPEMAERAQSQRTLDLLVEGDLDAGRPPSILQVLPYPVPPVGQPVSLDEADGPWGGEASVLQLFFHLLADVEVPRLALVGVAGWGEWGEAPPRTPGAGERGSNGSGFANSFQTQSS